MKDAYRNWKNYGAEVLNVINNYDDLIVFDTETTGFRKDAKIIQFSAILYKIQNDLTLKRIDALDVYINPEEPLSEKIKEITGISDGILRSSKTEKYWGPKIMDFLKKAPICVIHNAPFDQRMVQQMCERLTLPGMQNICLDTLIMARDIIPKTEIEDHKLKSVVEYVAPDKSYRFHSSIEDVEATATIFEYFLKFYNTHFWNQEEPKQQLRLTKARFFINPHKQSQKRIKLILNNNLEEEGYIFWDVVDKTWSCMSKPKARRLFKEIDIDNIEQQILSRYGWRYHANTMEQLAQNWEKERREYLKNKKTAS